MRTFCGHYGSADTLRTSIFAHFCIDSFTKKTAETRIKSRFLLFSALFANPPGFIEKLVRIQSLRLKKSL